MPESAMVDDLFWKTIASSTARPGEPDEQIASLRTALQQLSVGQVIAFEVSFRSCLDKAYTWDLWGAAYVIHGGCSDDGFEYFRRWLVSRGRDIYEAALADPESLALLSPSPGPEGYWEFEEIYYVIGEVFEELGGEGDVCDHSELEAGLDARPPVGEAFDEDEVALQERYPKLWERFGSNPLP
jgi:hypothetical protein